MFHSSIQAKLFAVGGAIALSLVSPNPAFSKLDCQNRNDPSAHTSDATTRTVKLEQFGIQVNVPSNYRALLYSNGTVEILTPGDFRIRQCVSQGQRIGTEVLPFLSFQLHPNPKNLRAYDFAHQRPLRGFSSLQQHRVNQIDLPIRTSRGGYDRVVGWYQPQGIQGIVEVSANTKDDLHNAIAQAKLMGDGSNQLDSTLQEAFDRLRNPAAGASQVTISRVNNFAEGPTQSTFTITTKGYLDDSVNGHKTIIQMKKLSDGSWTVTDQQRLTICQPGRGSQTGSTKPCY